MVQWSSFPTCKPRVLGSILRYPMATFLSLVLPPSGQRLPKLLPYCPQMGLTMLYTFEAVASIASLVLNVLENITIRGVTMKNLNLRQITGRGSLN